MQALRWRVKRMRVHRLARARGGAQGMASELISMGILYKAYREANNLSAASVSKPQRVV